MPLVALGDRDHQSQVRVDHALLRGRVSPFDPLGERDLLGRGQQGEASGPVHEQGQGVGRARELAAFERLANGRDNVDLASLELGPQRGELLLVEVVLGDERLERALLDRPPLLGIAEECLNRLFQNYGHTLLAFCRRRSKRAMRLPLEVARSLPV